VTPPLTRYRILDLTGTRGALCGRVLADLGAEVIFVEPPEGSAMRSRPPFLEGVAASEASESSIWFQHAAANKSHIVLDLETESGRARVLKLAREADALIESWDADERAALDLDGDTLLAANPRLVVTSITGFGLTGPHANYRTTDLVSMAVGGLLYVIGDPEAEPCVAPFEQAYGMTALHAAFATLVALSERESGAPGQVVDVSMQEVATHLTFSLAHYSGLQQITRRTGPIHGVVPNAPFEASDGYVSISMHDDRMWPPLVEWLNLDQLRAEEFRDRSVRADASIYLEPLIAQATRKKTRQELMEGGQRLRLAIMPINTLGEFVASEHARDHGLFRQEPHPTLGPTTLMPLQLVFQRTPPALRRTAPRLDEPDAQLEPRDPTALPSRPSQLSGIRVLDLTRVWAGPFCTRLLADFGAEVIRVESRRRLDTSRVLGELANPASKRRSQSMFSELNRNKRSLSLDLTTPEGRELVQQLAAQSDLVVDNLAPGVTDRLGLGYDELSKLNPAISTLSMPAFGSTGPLSDGVGYGGSLMAYSGMMRLWGLPETRPESLCHLAYPDYITAAFGACSAMAALADRAESGRGQRIELAQSDIQAWLMAPGFMEYIANDVEPPITGNHSRFFAPHALYRCLGDDAWLAIACEHDEQWTALVHALGDPEWARDPALATAEGRLAAEPEIDARIGEWAGQLTAFTAMRILQEAGVPAGVVQNGEDIYRDPHLRERGYILHMDDPDAGPITNPGFTTRLTGTPATIRNPAPLIGEANDYVLGDLLGLTAEQIADLEANGILN
jgi:crotonobetainyl-CoA:carnitine CoA-transferase CaiB-like acyl-CoA transferase